MRRLLGSALLLALALPSPARSQTGSAAVIDSATLAPGQYSGVLKTVPGSDRTFIVEVTSRVFVPNPSAAVNQANQAAHLARLRNQMAQAQRQLGRARTPQQRLQATRRLTQLQNQARQATVNLAKPAGRYQTVKRSIEFQAAEDVKVRSLKPLEAFDEKGNYKKYTREELAELKGKDRNLPGYESAPENLEVGMPVTLTLSGMPRRSSADDSADRSTSSSASAEKRVQVTLILTMQDN